MIRLSFHPNKARACMEPSHPVGGPGPLDLGTSIDWYIITFIASGRHRRVGSSGEDSKTIRTWLSCRSMIPTATRGLRGDLGFIVVSVLQLAGEYGRGEAETQRFAAALAAPGPRLYALHLGIRSA